MHRIIFLILSMFIFSSVNALELVRCVDGDTAVLIYENKEETVRFLGIDTPEYTKEKERFGKEASEFTCNSLKNAKEIRIELDANSDKYDKYNRLLAHIFVDNILLQEKILKQGFGEIKYIYGDYKYLDKLNIAENYAKANKLGIWSEEEVTYEYFLIILIIILLLILFKGDTKKTLKYLKKIKNIK